ncbi:MAG: hypothetical protein BWY79_01233 [Actinobacteria bacterium ADurb.Bin444]|nr:MAG: hypothetical protein BWY79_01233 [Actinobacteria bacterium ADurb.Bin444]
MPGLGSGDRGGDRLQIPHLPHQNHVGVLAQNGLQGSIERFGVGPDFPLIHHAVLMLMEELYGILHRHDVLRPRLIHFVYDGRECSGLSRSGRAGDKNETPRFLAESVNNPRKIELIDGHHVQGHQPKRGSEAVPLKVSVDTEAGPRRNGVREIDLPVGLQTLALILGQNAVDEVSGLHPLQRWILELHEPAVHSRHRGTTNSEMKVRSPHFQNLHQDVH